MKLAPPEEGGCILWTASLKGPGYGQLTLTEGSVRKNLSAHRLAWEFAYGPIPEGLEVCHTCDVRRCCNPAHLFLGTRQENEADKLRKGRVRRGKDNGQAKLTETDVVYIRQLHALGAASYETLAAMFNVTHGNVALIIKGKTWKHVEEKNEESNGSPTDGQRAAG